MSLGNGLEVVCIRHLLFMRAGREQSIVLHAVAGMVPDYRRCAMGNKAWSQAPLTGQERQLLLIRAYGIEAILARFERDRMLLNATERGKETP